MKNIITLITDFRSSDGYTGAIYGVIKSINPEAEIITITSEIPAGDIHKGSRALFNSYQFYPDGTINIAVVDPTVGSSRRNIIVYDIRHYFVGPDNGVFTPVYKKAKEYQCYQITNQKYRLTSGSDTFYGRDVFAPTAAYLSLGIAPDEFGSLINDPVMIGYPEPAFLGGCVIGKVIDIDTFGNLITNIPGSIVDKTATVIIRSHQINGLSKSYADVPEKQPLAYIGSAGDLEIAVNRGNAEELFGAMLFDEIKVIRADK